MNALTREHVSLQTKNKWMAARPSLSPVGLPHCYGNSSFSLCRTVTQLQRKKDRKWGHGSWQKWHWSGSRVYWTASSMVASYLEQVWEHEASGEKRRKFESCGYWWQVTTQCFPWDSVSLCSLALGKSGVGGGAAGSIAMLPRNTFFIFTLKCNFRTRLRGPIKPRVWGYNPASVSISLLLSTASEARLFQAADCCHVLSELNCCFTLYFSAQVNEPNPGSGSRTQTKCARLGPMAERRTARFLTEQCLLFIICWHQHRFTWSLFQQLVWEQSASGKLTLTLTLHIWCDAIQRLIGFDCSDELHLHQAPPHTGHLAIVKMESQIKKKVSCSSIGHVDKEQNPLGPMCVQCDCASKNVCGGLNDWVWWTCSAEAMARILTKACENTYGPLWKNGRAKLDHGTVVVEVIHGKHCQTLASGSWGPPPLFH